MNRLASESSPYLRQHATNPVNWFPWGDEAFAEARGRDVPVLLSIGYSSCHWCHVMAHESFEDRDTAALMNDGFVNVKVDREERPDVDGVYMTAVTTLTGRGGWPMTVFCHPDGRPFHGGTYWPDRPRGGMPSFSQILIAVREAWADRRSDLDDAGSRLTAAIARQADISPDDAPPPKGTFQSAALQLVAQHDSVWGGFGGAPKFPQAMGLETLLRYVLATGDPTALEVVTTTLDAMASGGIYDHLGGGFSRYSVDDRWLVPHFEKMLYDNALLSRAYLHAWQVTGHDRWFQVASETIDYVRRDLRHPGGGFYSAEDADSEGVEGKFYIWSEKEIREVCRGDTEAALSWYGVTPKGNFEGANILIRPERGALVRPEDVERSRVALFRQRERRIRPGLDDKVLTEWNGLMLSTLAEAAAATGRTDWLEDAVSNAQFLWENLRRDDGRWMRSWQAEGGAQHLGYAADHAAMVDGLVRLGEATGEARWTDMAVDTADTLITRFSDQCNGGFFSTGDDAEALITRPKDVFDNAHPSANSLAALALLRLGALTGEGRFTDAAESVLRLLGRNAASQPTAFGRLLEAIDLFHSGTTEVVVTGDRADLVSAVASSYRPNTVLAWGERRPGPLWDGREGNQAWVCQNRTCT
nr:thioredoxin domain-containing protein [Acidimicrobiales bacterium]